MVKYFRAFRRRNASGILVKLAFEKISDCKVEADPSNAASSMVVTGLFLKEMEVRPAGRLPEDTVVM